MNASHPLLQIHIHKADGSSETFVQNEEDLAKLILGEFRPERVFTRDKITIAGDCSLTSFPVSRVARLDLISEQLPGWLLPSAMVNALELSESEFHALLQSPELAGQLDPVQSLDESVVVFLEVEMAGQPPLFLAMEITGEQLADLPETVASLFAAPALCFRMRSGGIAVLNPVHLVGVTLFPGSQPLPPDAWPAQRAKGRELPRPEPEIHGPADSPALPAQSLQTVG